MSLYIFQSLLRPRRRWVWKGQNFHPGRFEDLRNHPGRAKERLSQVTKRAGWFTMPVLHLCLTYQAELPGTQHCRWRWTQDGRLTQTQDGAPGERAGGKNTHLSISKITFDSWNKKKVSEKIFLFQQSSSGVSRQLRVERRGVRKRE